MKTRDKRDKSPCIYLSHSVYHLLMPETMLVAADVCLILIATIDLIDNVFHVT